MYGKQTYLTGRFSLLLASDEQQWKAQLLRNWVRCSLISINNEICFMTAVRTQNTIHIILCLLLLIPKRHNIVIRLKKMVTNKTSIFCSGPRMVRSVSLRSLFQLQYYISQRYDLQRNLGVILKSDAFSRSIYINHILQHSVYQIKR